MFDPLMDQLDIETVFYVVVSLATNHLGIISYLKEFFDKMKQIWPSG